MFKSLKRITYPVAEMGKARQWYCDILESQPIFETPFAVIFKVGDCSLSLTQGRPPLSENPERVETYWEVEDIEASYRRLIESGAIPHTPVKAVLNIRTAKVMDPFGNIIGLTGAALKAKERSVENQPSKTAKSAAFCRALAAKDDREEISGSDFMAELFLTEEGRKPLNDSASRKWAIQQLVSSPLYGYLIARTAYIDSLFRDSLSKDIPQIVFLGAGYDTRAYRFRQLIHNTRVFEMDIQSTQRNKIKILKDAKIEIPPQVSFVSINFKLDRIEEALAKAGYDKSLNTLFIWEGVIYYLPEEAIGDTLRFLQTCSPAGSTLCFDYMTEELESVNAAEPFRFWIEPDKIEAFLSNYGLKIIEHVDSKDMEKRYLTLRDGSLAEKALTRFCLVRAEVGA